LALTTLLNFKKYFSGARSLMALIPALFHSRNSEKVYLIDEIDRSMHLPLSCEFFYRPIQLKI
jgi:AAA15 family ATPase/GTPase